MRVPQEDDVTLKLVCLTIGKRAMMSSSQNTGRHEKSYSLRRSCTPERECDKYRMVLKSRRSKFSQIRNLIISLNKFYKFAELSGLPIKGNNQIHEILSAIRYVTVEDKIV